MNKPAKCISVDSARRMRDQWLQTRGAYYKMANDGEQDCSDVLYSVKELEEYIAYVKAESTKQGIENPGIRIYFAAYDDGSQKATVFLTGTDGDQSDSPNNYKVDPLNVGQNGWPPNNY